MPNSHIRFVSIIILLLSSDAYANKEFECSLNNFFGKPMQKASPRIEDILDRIVTIGEVKQKYTICAAPSIKGAGAAIHWNTAKRVIIYNPTYLDKSARLSGDYHWGMVTIMAHEVGHHVRNHTKNRKERSLQQSREYELDADRFAGYVLANLGASLDNSQALMKQISTNINDSLHTHPSGEKRVEAITTGWEQACKILGKECNNPLMKNTKKPTHLTSSRLISTYKTVGYEKMLSLSSSFKGKIVTRDYCKAYANVSIAQAINAKQAGCGFNVDKSSHNNQWSVYWKPQYDWCMQYSAYASGNEILFRETKLRSCINYRKIEGSKAEQTSCLKDDSLHRAAAQGNVEFVQTCLQLGVSPNVKEHNNWTPLHSAARSGHLKVVKLLIQNKAEINAKDINNRTPLDHAIIGKHQMTANYLESNGGIIRQ